MLNLTQTEFYILIITAFFLALETISGVISTPITFPLAPTIFDARKQSTPPPLPRSSTTSPTLRSAKEIGVAAA